MHSVCIWYSCHACFESIVENLSVFGAEVCVCVCVSVCVENTHTRRKLWEAGIYALSLSIAIMVSM